MSHLGLDLRAPIGQTRVVKSCGPSGLQDLAFLGASAGGDADGRCGAIPRHRPLEAFTERRARAEAEQLLGPRDVETPPGLAVRLRGVPDDLTVEAGRLRHEARELADRDLIPGSDVHGL